MKDELDKADLYALICGKLSCVGAFFIMFFCTFKAQSENTIAGFGFGTYS